MVHTLLKSIVSLRSFLQIATLISLLYVISASYGLSTGEKPHKTFAPADVHETNKTRSQTSELLIPEGTVATKKPHMDIRKKKKKLSNLERLRQLYLLPLLQPLVSGSR